MKIAVIGSGLSGLSFAKTLESNAGIDLFDKSRGYGGRMATRRDAEYQFDHGAQYFTVKADEFRSFLQPYLDNEIVKPWEANYVELDRETITSSQTWTAESGHYVGSPNMSSLCREIASDHNVNLNTEIMKIDRRDGKWVLIDKNNNSVSGYDWVVFAVTPQHIENIMSRQHHGRDYYLNTVLKLASVGDWYINARVESAFLSGHRAAIKLKELL
jgi:predicted NAD/FAD-dependent oxidoreductase